MAVHCFWMRLSPSQLCHNKGKSDFVCCCNANPTTPNQFIQSNACVCVCGFFNLCMKTECIVIVFMLLLQRRAETGPLQPIPIRTHTHAIARRVFSVHMSTNDCCFFNRIRSGFVNQTIQMEIRREFVDKQRPRHRERRKIKYLPKVFKDGSNSNSIGNLFTRTTHLCENASTFFLYFLAERERESAVLILSHSFASSFGFSILFWLAVSC